MSLKFQSTHPHGVRHASFGFIGSNLDVSIHAPTRGATNRRGPWQVADRFQSTHPHGVRQDTCPPLWCLLSFNPRTHTGCDHFQCTSINTTIGFQSTHPHGVRLTKTEVLRQYRTFQSTHPHGVRLRLTRSNVILSHNCFNPRTHTGCDSVQSYIL